MSCLDVMYHSQGAYHQPYQPYSFYQRHFSQKFGHYKMQDPLDSPIDYTSSHHHHPPSAPSSHNHHHYHTTASSSMAPHTVTSASPPVAISQPVKEEDRTTTSVGDNKDTQPPEAEYFSSRCVVFTFYTGEINKVVDDHFSRALSQPSSFTSEGVKKSTSSSSSSISSSPTTTPSWNNKNTDNVPPMCQRNFPPSFWNSNYINNTNNSIGYSTSASSSFPHGSHHAADSLFGSDSYSSAASLHHRTTNDPWAHHYPFGSPPQGGYSAHRSIHDLSYGAHHHHMATTSAFNPRYSSLLIQPPVRPGRLPPTMPGGSQCDFSKSTTEWPSAYSTAAAAHSVASQPPQSYAGTIETASTSTIDAQDTSKDLYWF